MLTNAAIVRATRYLLLYMTYEIENAVNEQVTQYIISNNDHYMHPRVSTPACNFIFIVYAIALHEADAQLVTVTTFRTDKVQYLVYFYSKVTHQILTVH
jgi:hypothetical protein